MGTRENRSNDDDDDDDDDSVPINRFDTWTTFTLDAIDSNVFESFVHVAVVVS
mgnify:CR=1 FL=1